MSTAKFVVATRDVDGGDRRSYATLAAAVKRFEEMSGWKIANAIAEQFYHLESPPAIEGFVGTIRAVSSFGCVVTLTCPERT